MSDPASQLETYLVGGAVRDELMGRPVKDRDWVVVGATPERMAELGFRPVGRHFPVFLHPDTHEEYALARTEKKVSTGYHGFEFNSSPDITLEQDLQRRDLTINAMARDRDGAVVDPYGGKRDLDARVLRHVSESFREDPVRVLRVARLAARYHDLGFGVHDSTLELMRRIVADGEVDALVPERVWRELHDSFSEPACFRFIEVLRECGALARVLPEVDALFGVPQVEKYHPEIDTGIHTLMSLQAARRISDDPLVMFAVLVHDLGKALTPSAELPRHRGHERLGLKPIEALCKRVGAPSAFREFALKVCEYHLHCHRIGELRPATVLKVLEALDGFRNPERVGQFAQACLADRRGRTGHEQDGDEDIQVLERCHRAALDVDAGAVAKSLASADGKAVGKAIGEAVRRARVAAIAEVRRGAGPA